MNELQSSYTQPYPKPENFRALRRNLGFRFLESIEGFKVQSTFKDSDIPIGVRSDGEYSLTLSLVEQADTIEVQAKYRGSRDHHARMYEAVDAIVREYRLE